MPDLDRIQILIQTLPGARAQVTASIPTPTPGMRLGTPAHSLTIDALGWLRKQPAVAGFVFAPSSDTHDEDKQILLAASGTLQAHGYPAAAAAVLRAMDTPCWQGMPPALTGSMNSPASPATTYLAEVQQHQSTCSDPACRGCVPVQAAHIVLDLETLSTQPNAAIASIGAVALTAGGGFVSEFHLAVDAGAPQHLRHVCANTCAWWDKQSEDAKLGSIHAPNPTLPHQALEAFTAWVQQHADPKKVKVWGNGSSFDNVILSSLYADYPELVRPWAYWNDRDMRTVLDLHPQAKNVGDFEGVKHNALHDARHEAKQLAAVLRAAQAEPSDPLDWPLPCDVTVGHGTIGKGVALRTLVHRMKGLYKLATGNDADEVAARPPEQRAQLLADFQERIGAIPAAQTSNGEAA